MIQKRIHHFLDRNDDLDEELLRNGWLFVFVIISGVMTIFGIVVSVALISHFIHNIAGIVFVIAFFLYFTLFILMRGLANSDNDKAHAFYKHLYYNNVNDNDDVMESNDEESIR